MNLHTATINGEEVVGVQVDNIFYGMDEKVQLYAERNITNLTPVRVVPKDAVVIEGRASNALSDLITSLEKSIKFQHPFGHISPNSMMADWVKDISASLSQLTPSATTDEGGAGEDQPLKDVWACKNCDIKFFTVRTAAEHDCKPTPTVTIELTEDNTSLAEDIRFVVENLLAYNDSANFPMPNVSERARKLLSRLTPPLSEEPKGFALSDDEIKRSWSAWHTDLFIGNHKGIGPLPLTAKYRGNEITSFMVIPSGMYCSADDVTELVPMMLVPYIPPRPEELKGFGAIVKAHTASSPIRQRWVYVGGWWIKENSNASSLCSWESLINPVIISEGVE